MKTILALSALVLSTSAFASPLRLMDVSKHSGFTPPKYAYALECQIFADSTFRKFSSGELFEEKSSYLPTIYTADVPNADAARALIEKATEGKLTTMAGPTDGPSSSYEGVLQAPVVTKIVTLVQTGMGFIRNTSSAVPALVEFADLNCTLPNSDR